MIIPLFNMVGLVTSAARAHLWYLMLAKNEDRETRKSDSKHFVHIDAEFQEQSKGGSMESIFHFPLEATSDSHQRKEKLV